mgnify:FL=1
MNSLLLALQFFTIIPVKKNLPMEKRQITGMYTVFPLVGAGIGAVASLALYFEWSSLMTAFVIVSLGILLSGGLHMDGFIDTSDAFFSYRDLKKRMEILDDPRVGAFGVMAIVLLIVGKVIIIAEVLSSESFHWIFIMIIPVLSRIVLVTLFSTTVNAKESGLAHFFKQKIHIPLLLPLTACSLFIAICLIGLTTYWLIAITILSVLVVFSCVYRSWTLKNFGGITGDLLGASLELTEVILWITLLLLLS